METNDKKPEIKITISQDGVITPALTAIKECSQSILFGLKSIDQITKLPDFQSQDEKYLKQQFGEPDPFDIQKNKYKSWLLTKGFEELIEGIKLTLVEAFRYVSIYNMFGGNTEKIETTLEKINKDFDELREHSGKQSLPALFEKIRPYITSQLLYENHIKTLNKARNCLVHRKGKVTPEDTNTKNNTLKINWIRYFIFFDYKDGEVEFIPGHITKESVEIKIRIKEEEKEFNLNETISFTFEELQEFMTTCHQFLIDLASKLPIIKEKTTP